MQPGGDRVRELYRVALRGNPEELAPLLDADATWSGAAGTRWKPCETRDEIARTLIWRTNALRLRPRGTVDVGNKVVVDITGTRLRQLGGRGLLLQRLYQVVTLREGRVVAIEDFGAKEQAYAAAGLRP